MEEGWKAKLACRSAAFKVTAAEPRPSYCGNWQEPLLGQVPYLEFMDGVSQDSSRNIQRAAELVINQLPCCSFVVVTVRS